MIRSFGLRDVLMLKQLEHQGVFFDSRRWLLDAPSSALAAVIGYLTQYHMGAVTCVQDGRGRANCGLQGAAQAWPRWDQAEWDLAFLSPSLTHQGDITGLWHDLLVGLVLQAAEQNIQRIYARSTEDGEIEEVLRQAGFTTVAREEIFVHTGRTTPAPPPKGLRRVTAEDRQPLNAFFQQVTPHLVQQAEWPLWQGLVPSHHPARRAWSSEEFLWSDKGKIIAHLRLLGSSRGAWLEVAVRPEYRADTLPCLKYMLTWQREAGKPLYCPVADYGVGMGWLLRTLGFESFTRQVLLVAHTVSCVPVRKRLVVPGLNTGVETGFR